jgi:hypothetical protein
MSHSSTLPPGTLYRQTDGSLHIMIHEAKLIYMWGAKGTVSMDARPFYYVPIYGGHVGLWISPNCIVKHVFSI